VKTAIFGAGDMDGEHQVCQSEEFAEQETRDYMSSGVADVGDLVASSCHAVGGRVGIGDVELGSEEFDGFVEKDIGQVPTTECAGMATAQSTTWQESANHFEVVLG
jgi:hypothetical protein